MAREMTREQYVKLAEALDFLEWYHMEQSKDEVSQFRGKRYGDGQSVDIYLVSDPEWQQRLRAATAAAYREP